MNGFINYVSFPRSARELKNKLDDDGMTDIKLIFDGFFEWTVSPVAKKGDLVLFYHTASALNNIKKVEEEAKKEDEIYDYLKYDIKEAYEYYDKFGKAIFAIGVVGSDPEFDEDAFDYTTHFKERCFAPIRNSQILECPVNIEKFSKFLDIYKQTSKTPIDRQSLIEVLKIIKETNSLSDELLSAINNYINSDVYFNVIID